jgi:4-amino-4-deoxy-L-arabinose transferase-like glycosyltransferase
MSRYLSGESRVLLLLLLAVLIRIPLAVRPMTATSDPWRETDTASIAHNFYVNPQPSIFYPQINWGGNGPGYVEAEFQLFPYITALLYRLFGENIIFGRIVSMIFNLMTCVVFYRLARRLFGERVAFWSLLFFIIAPLNSRYSTAFMPEATMFFFYVSGLYLFVRWLDEGQDVFLWLAAVSTAVSILVKPTSILIGLIFFLLLFERYKWRVLVQPKLWLFAAIALIPGLLWYLHARDLYLIYGNTFGVISGGDSKFGNIRTWFSPGFYAELARLDIIYVFGQTSVLLFIAGMIVYLRQRRSSLLLYSIIAIVPYYVILSRYTGNSAGLQYHIFALVYAALGTGIGMVWLLDWLTQRIANPAVYRALAGAVVILCLFIPTTLLASLLDQTPVSLAACGAAVAQHVPEGQLVIVSTVSPSLENGVVNNFQEPEIFFYSQRYGWSLPSDQHTPEQVESLRSKGAAYLVVYSAQLVEANPALVEYLKNDATLIDKTNCQIYQFT